MSSEPTGDQATASTQSAWPARVVKSSPLLAFQTLISFIEAPTTIRCASGAQAIDQTEVALLRFARSPPESGSQTFTVRSEEPEASPPPDQAKDVTQVEWPLSVVFSAQSDPQILTVASLDPEARRSPLGDQATADTGPE